MTYAYAEPGSYEVRLVYEVIDTSNRIHRDEETLTIRVSPPELGDLTATMIVTPEPPWRSGAAITFDGTASAFQIAPPASLGLRWTFEWSFGDGSATIRGGRVDHTFLAPGDLIVELSVVATDRFDREWRATASQTLHIGNSSPTAVGAVRPTGGARDVRRGRAVMLDASGSIDPDGHDLTFAWDIDGDGMDDVKTTDAVFRYEPGFPDAGEQHVTLHVWDSYMLDADQPPVSTTFRVAVAGGLLPPPDGGGVDLGAILLSGGMLSMGELRLWNAAIGMSLLDGRLLALAGYGASAGDVELDMTDSFPSVELAGYSVNGTITKASALTLSAFYGVHPTWPVFAGGSIGYLSYGGSYEASCRVSIGGELPPVVYSESKILIGAGVAVLLGFFVISFQAVLAL